MYISDVTIASAYSTVWWSMWFNSWRSVCSQWNHCEISTWWTIMEITSLSGSSHSYRWRSSLDSCAYAKIRMEKNQWTLFHFLLVSNFLHYIILFPFSLVNKYFKSRTKLVNGMSPWNWRMYIRMSEGKKEKQKEAAMHDAYAVVSNNGRLFFFFTSL